MPYKGLAIVDPQVLKIFGLLGSILEAAVKYYEILILLVSILKGGVCNLTLKYVILCPLLAGGLFDLLTILVHSLEEGSSLQKSL